MADPTYYTQDFTDLRLPDSANPKEVDKCIPRFFTTDSMRKNAKGEDEMISIEMVEIITPGDRLSRPVQKVGEDHKRRWARAYAAFKAGIDPTLQGTAIGTWRELSWQMQLDMRGAGFQTVEQLAEAHDGMLEGIPNGTFWRKKAQIFVQGKTVVSDKDKEINELKDRLAKLEAASVLPQSKSRDGDDSVQRRRAPTVGRRPGRPRKTAVVDGVQSQAPESGTA